MKRPISKSNDELRPEYDLRELFRKGVRGKHAKAYRLALQRGKIARAQA